MKVVRLPGGRDRIGRHGHGLDPKCERASFRPRCQEPDCATLAPSSRPSGCASCRRLLRRPRPRRGAQVHLLPGAAVERRTHATDLDVHPTASPQRVRVPDWRRLQQRDARRRCRGRPVLPVQPVDQAPAASGGCQAPERGGSMGSGRLQGTGPFGTGTRVHEEAPFRPHRAGCAREGGRPSAEGLPQRFLNQARPGPLSRTCGHSAPG